MYECMFVCVCVCVSVNNIQNAVIRSKTNFTETKEICENESKEKKIN